MNLPVVQVARLDLSADELDLCHSWAEQRNGIQTRRRVANKRAGEHGDVGSHFLGVCGEYAAAMELGLQLHVDWHPVLPKGDPGVDLRVRGVTVSVKAGSEPWHNLVQPPHRDMTCDVAILAIVIPPEVRLVGWIDRAAWLEVRKWGAEFPVPAWYVSQADLRPMSELQDAIGNLARS